MKNILLVTQGFPFGKKESGFLPTEYERLSRQSHLTVLAFEKNAPLQHPLAEGVDHRRYGWESPLTRMGLLKQLRHREVRQDLLKALKAGMAQFRRCAGRILAYSLRAEQLTPMLRSLIDEKQIDVVYTYWCLQMTIAALRLKKEFPNLKVVTRFHGIDLFPERTAENWQPLRDYSARHCDLLLFVSKQGKRFFLDTWGQQWEGKSKISYVGCRPLPMVEKVQESPLVLVSCSDLIPIKRVHRIIEGLAALPEEIAVHWHHFGEGECGDALKALAAERLANRSSVCYTFHGYVHNTVLPQVYQQLGAAVLITTSESEGLPVSLMEAYAMGIPVIATGVGGIPEMVQDGENGYLLPADVSAEEVAQAIERFVSLSAAEKLRMRQSARESWQKDYNAAENAEKLMCLLDRL